MTAPVVVGVDAGTSAIKAATFGADGEQVASGRAVTPWRTVPTGAEIDPGALLGASLAAIEAALRGVDGRVAAIGVAGMAETGVLVDARGRPVVPSIGWHDSRGDAEAARIAAALPAFPERTGLPATRMCTLAKYAWMRAHWPDAARGRRWISVPEWIVRGLGGEGESAEASLAARTGFYDLHTGAPYADALAWAEAPSGLAPPAMPAGTPLGRGPGGAVLAVGGHDHPAAAVGAGAAGEGDVLDDCGTAEAIVRATAPLPPGTVGRAVAQRFTVGRHALAGRFVLQGSVRSGRILHTVLELLGVEPDDRGPLEAAALEAEPGGLALEGLRADSLSVTGLAPGTSPAALYRAALEAIGAADADILAGMEALAGPARRLVVTGGWAEGVAARAVKERHLGPFERSPVELAGCRGAALAAARAAGLAD